MYYLVFVDTFIYINIPIALSTKDNLILYIALK